MKAEELQKVVERIAYEQTAEDQSDDLFNKMGILNEFVNKQISEQSKWISVEDFKTPYLDYLIRDHKNHIEHIEAISNSGIQETRNQLAELERIKSIILAKTKILPEPPKE